MAKSAGGKFTDNEFPPENKSIGSGAKMNTLTKGMAWLRPEEIFKGDFKLFDGIDPTDIKQGQLGVCYMLATISALASNPKNIERIFVLHDLEIGFYVLRFYKNGKPEYLVIDDNIPCNATVKTPLFTKPIGN